MHDRPALAIALFMLIGAIVFTSARPGARDRNDSARPRADAAEKIAAPPPPAAGPAAQIWMRQCGIAPEPLRHVCSALYDPSAKPPDTEPGKPPDWRAQPWIGEAKKQVRQIIVAVADPDETGDTLRFDRGIETVQSAAEASRYSFHSYWIPWRANRSASEPATDGRRPQQDREPACEPGVLFFRSASDFLAVYVVGESAFSGVNPLQFQNAIDYMRALSASVETVYIAGPNYSGSLAPLKQTLDHAKAAAGIQRFRVISPSATNRTAGAAFRRRPDIDYWSVIHNDAYAHRRFMDYLGERWLLDPSEVAFLSESGTVFGGFRPGASRDQSTSPLFVRFPRGLSRLRNASPEASTAALFAPGEAAPQSGKITFSLRGPGPGRDTVPSLGSAQVPVAQETVLVAISAALRQENIKLAHIVSSDIYDAIFLAGFMRKAYPDVRPYFANADSLIPRASDQMPLDGSLSVTTFPLIARNQLWTSRSGSRSLMPASSRYEAGLFNAVRAILLEQKPPDDDSLSEYSFNGSKYPPLWLTVAGTNGYWPIALLDHGDGGCPSPAAGAATPGSENECDPLLLKGKPATASGAAKWPSPGSPTRIWHIAFYILVLLGFAFGLGIALAQSERIRESAGSRVLAAVAARPEEPGALGRAYFALGQCLVTAVMLFALAFPQWVLTMRAEHSGWATLDMCLSMTAFGLLIAGAAAPWVSVWRGGPHLKSEVMGIEPAHWLYAWFAGLGLLGFIAFISIWSYACVTQANFEGFFFCYRSLDLLNGACPPTPFLALGAGLLVLTSLHRRRQALFLELPDALPDLETDTLAAGIQSGIGRVRNPLGHPLVSSTAAGLLVAAAGLVPILLFPLFEGQQSLEGIEYDVLYKCTVAVFYALVVFTWARFLVAWLSARRVLDRLASHPLRLAFARLADSNPVGAILHGGAGADANHFVAGSVNLLRSLASTARHEATRHKLNERLAAVESVAAECLRLDRPRPAGPVGHLRAVQRLFAAVGTDVARMIEGGWKKGCPAALAPVGDTKPAAETSSAFARSAADFIALQYVAFIANAMQQFRMLLRYVTVGFFLGLVSTMLYPFRSHHAIAWAATLNFMLLGTPVLIAILRIERHPLMRTLTRAGDSSRIAGFGRLALYAALPVFALISSYFPALGRYLVTVLQPAMQAVR